MGIEIGKSAVLIQRVLLDIESRGVDMSTEDIHSVLHRLMAYFHQYDGLVHPYSVDLVTGRKGPAFLYQSCELHESAFLRLIHDRIHALALCLGYVEELLIFLGKIIGFLYSLIAVGRPYISSVHKIPFSFSLQSLPTGRPTTFV